jgi:prepilin-type processing-associated H-X9-DG protein
MPRQLLLPGFPDGSSRIGDALSILKKDGRVTYFVGGDNYFSHEVGDASSHRFILASLMDNGHVRASDLKKAPLCIPQRTLMNWLEKLRGQGPDSFFRPARRAEALVMTPQVVARCENLLGSGESVSAVARRAGILESTLRKAIARGAVRKAPGESAQEAAADEGGSTKSERSRLDAQAGMGTACTRADERMAAAMGIAASTSARFERCDDVVMGGLLVGLPALCANGLFSGIGKHLSLPRGFYSCLHILLTLGFMALARIRRPEGLRHIPPGEFGKVIGLDRVPEVRTLREKITMMASSGDPDAWMRELSRSWMEEAPGEAGYLYVDGHVRVYHGKTANLPRRYVSRDRLCLRGTTDYWVNDAVGRPFFVVSKAVTDGLAKVLRTEIVPELLDAVPGQPTKSELEADPLLHRFVCIFDREGATHSLLAALWEKRVGAITYRKNVKDKWSENEFAETEVSMPGGGLTKMMLAQRETELSAGKESITVMEVRRLTKTGHQTAVISTARRLDATVIAGRMFARWCQENYFAYMMQHYDIDGLVQYGAEALSGTIEVINPAWRSLDKAVKSANRNLQKLQAKLGAQIEMNDAADIQKKAECLEDIQAIEAQCKELRAKRKEVKRKVPLSELSEEQRPTQLLPLNKTLSDTVKMIAYRAETALVEMLYPHLQKEGEARAIVRELLVSSADIAPDDYAQTLTVRIHRMACPAHDTAVAALLEDLTKLEFRHPETKAKMIYQLA